VIRLIIDNNKGDKMKLINKTKLNDKALLDMITFAHVNTEKVASITIVDVESSSIEGNYGRCSMPRKGHFIVSVTNEKDEYLETLIHELVHINHFLAVKQLSEYKEEKQSRLAEKRLIDTTDL
jgi:hypothetical protein